LVSFLWLLFISFSLPVVNSTVIASSARTPLFTSRAPSIRQNFRPWSGNKRPHVGHSFMTTLTHIHLLLTRENMVKWVEFPASSRTRAETALREPRRTWRSRTPGSECD